MAAKAKAHTSPEEEAAEDEVFRCDSVPPPPGEEGYAKPTEVRELPANLLELLKKSDTAGAADAEIADVADLANLILSSRVRTDSGPPVSGVVPKGEEEQEERVPIAPPPPPVPRNEIPPRAPFSFDQFSPNVLFAGVVLGLILAYVVVLLAVR
jgi:hypothetical protein